jgi:hypothetical protein
MLPILKTPHAFDLYSRSIVIKTDGVHVSQEYHKHLEYLPKVKNADFIFFNDMKLKAMRNFFICGRTGR